MTIDEPDLCPRYAAAVADVTVGASPPWMTRRLQAAGIRPISSIVDLTNYVLIELGHPMHAFDLAKLAGPEIRVRLATAGETITTLDGVERTLDPEMLVIADRDRAQAIAGVMGGAGSEVSPGTRRVAFESAYFQPASVRRTSKRLNLKTEASSRFERGADIGAPVVALQRLVALIDQIGGGRTVGPVIDVYPNPRPAPDAPPATRASRFAAGCRGSRSGRRTDPAQPGVDGHADSETGGTSRFPRSGSIFCARSISSRKSAATTGSTSSPPPSRSSPPRRRRPTRASRATSWCAGC